MYELINEKFNQTVIQGNAVKHSEKELDLACYQTQSSFHQCLGDISGVVGCYNDRYLPQPCAPHVHTLFFFFLIGNHQIGERT